MASSLLNPYLRASCSFSALLKILRSSLSISTASASSFITWTKDFQSPHCSYKLFGNMTKSVFFFLLCTLSLLSYALAVAGPESLKPSRKSKSFFVEHQRAVGCPYRCRSGKQGYLDAVQECGGRRCYNDGPKCEVRLCPFYFGENRFWCACPYNRIRYCPQRCRLGKLGQLIARIECRDRPTCFSSDKKCTVQGCTLNGRKGTECGCPQPVATIEPNY